jgi:hypothetical protein
MVVNFKAHEINRGARKLVRRLTLIKKNLINMLIINQKKKTNHIPINAYLFLFDFEFLDRLECVLWSKIRLQSFVSVVAKLFEQFSCIKKYNLFYSRI